MSILAARYRREMTLGVVLWFAIGVFAYTLGWRLLVALVVTAAARWVFRYIVSEIRDIRFCRLHGIRRF